MMNLNFGNQQLLLLLLLVPLFGLLTLRLGRRSGRLRKSVVALRMAVLVALILAIAEPLSVKDNNVCHDHPGC